MKLVEKLLIKMFRKLQKLERKDRELNTKRKYNIPASFRFNGNHFLIYGKGKIEVGENSYIGDLCTIQLEENHKVTIGKGCSISHNVRIYTGSKDPSHDFADKNKVPGKNGDVLIGDYVWIGANTFINPGVTIGENSVVGANSVVTKNIEPNSIYGGVPAKLIKMKPN